ncbi:MAG: cyclodeaminase/cyclohydrolase family protein [Desulfobacterales bacterium]|nr:cyclodeaminase/cyclohydrolase family protein [Desulfobacterales bacterium]
MEFKNLTIEKFIQEVDSESPTPGGGSVAAIAGSLSAALTAMVFRISIKKMSDESAINKFKASTGKAEILKTRFLSLADSDAAAFDQVMESFRMPKDTEEQKSKRGKTIQMAFHNAVSVPMETLRSADELIAEICLGIEKGNPNCLSDVGTALQLINTCAYSALYNVRINLQTIKDEKFVDDCMSSSQEIIARIKEKVQEMNSKIMETF